TKALSNIRILDLSRVLAGPWATQMLGDLGAEVIKIEQPGKGDDTRAWGPPWHGEGDEALSAYYLSCNRNKQSVAIDITTVAGQDVIRALAAQSDVLVENFKLGGLAKYGLDYESLKGANPRLIYCSVTGFGQDGPRAALPGYDFMIQGMSGMMSVTGDPATGPQKSGVAYADVMTGLHAAIAVLAALNQRHATGRGQYIDIAMFDVGVSTLANQALNYLVSGQPPVLMGNAHMNVVPYQAFATLDGHLILAVGNDAQFARFGALIGKADWGDDPLFATNSARIANRTALIPDIAYHMATRTTADWVAALTDAGIPHGPINRIDQALADPQAIFRSLVTDAGGRPGIASPLRLSDSPPDAGSAPPILGADTKAVLKRLLGLDDDQIAAVSGHGL
ncbi:MAG: CaiB/BaiF CoA transferase family protein, partial [Sphingomonadaceae bacterium]